MNKERVYCVSCDEEVDYIIKEETKKVTVKGREFEVTLKRTYCAKCGEPVSVDKIAKQNDLIVFDEYRRLENLLTSEQIKTIRTKRGLSQVALARLIDCGEKNIARYETGTIQDRAFDLLIRLVDDDRSYEVLKIQKLGEEVKKSIFAFAPVKGHDKQKSCEMNNSNINEYEYVEGGVQNGRNRIKTQQVFCNNI